MNRLKLTSQSGFTIAEMMVSAMLSLMVLGSVYGVFRAQSHTVKGQESRMEAQEYGLSSVDMMVREIRNTGYFPGALCNATGGVVAATATTFGFVYDADGNGACAGTDEAVTYQVAAGDITRTANGVTQALTNANVTAFQFIYYPQQIGNVRPPPYCYAAAGDLVVNGVTCSGIVTANLAGIQQVVINVTVRARSNDTQFGGQSTLTTSATADLRNHGLPPA
jgi:hypothetical protein